MRTSLVLGLICGLAHLCSAAAPPQPEAYLRPENSIRLSADKNPGFPHQASCVGVRFLAGKTDQIGTCHVGGHVVAWDLKEKKIIWRAVAEMDQLYALEASPDGKFLFCLGNSGLLRTYKCADGELVFTARIFEERSPTPLTVSRAAPLLVYSRGNLRTELVWQTYSSDPEFELGDQGSVRQKGSFMGTARAASDDGKKVAMTSSYSIDNRIQKYTLDVYNTATQALEATYERSEDMSPIALTPDCKTAAFWGGPRDPAIYLVDLEKKQETMLHGDIDRFQRMRFTADGAYLVFQAEPAQEEGKPEYSLRVFEVATGKFKYAVAPRSYSPPSDSNVGIRDFDFSADGKKMALAIVDRSKGPDAAGLPDILVFDFLP